MFGVGRFFFFLQGALEPKFFLYMNRMNLRSVELIQPCLQNERFGSNISASWLMLTKLKLGFSATVTVAFHIGS